MTKPYCSFFWRRPRLHLAVQWHATTLYSCLQRAVAIEAYSGRMTACVSCDQVILKFQFLAALLAMKEIWSVGDLKPTKPPCCSCYCVRRVGQQCATWLEPIMCLLHSELCWSSLVSSGRLAEIWMIAIIQNYESQRLTIWIFEKYMKTKQN